MLQVTRQTDYGLLLVSALATHHHNEFVSLRVLAKERGLPYRFLTKISIPLRKGGIIEAQEGAHGGYRLARSPERIQIREVLEALGENLSLVRCGSDDVSCQSYCQCNARGFWDDVQRKVDEVISGYTMADLIEKNGAEHPNVDFLTQ